MLIIDFYASEGIPGPVLKFYCIHLNLLECLPLQILYCAVVGWMFGGS